MKDNNLTLKDIDDAIKIIKRNTECNKCKTNKNYVVLGYYGIYCKCEADRLSKTQYAKVCQEQIRRLPGFP